MTTRGTVVRMNLRPEPSNRTSQIGLFIGLNVFATDDRGFQQGWDKVGTLKVRKK